MRLEPKDRTTGWPKTLRPRVLVKAPAALDERTLRELRAATALLALPGRIPIAVDVTTASPEKAANEVVIEVRPRKLLADGWYSLQISSLRGDLRWADRPMERSRRAASRFRVGTGPVVREVWMCRGREPGAWVRLEMSEPIARRRIHDVRVELDPADPKHARRSSCHLEPRADGRTLILGLCSGIDRARKVRIRLSLREAIEHELGVEFRLTEASDNGSCWRYTAS